LHPLDKKFLNVWLNPLSYDAITFREIWCPILSLTPSTAYIENLPVHALLITWKRFKTADLRAIPGSTPFSSVKQCSTTPIVFNRAFKTSSTRNPPVSLHRQTTGQRTICGDVLLMRHAFYFIQETRDIVNEKGIDLEGGI
jgi:hypothetical protein